MKREIFNNKDFRIGLSYAIDRQAIIDAAFVGQGEPWQAAPRKESPYYNERLAKQYTEFDVAKANEHLDKAYPKKDGEGFRLGPDGKRISFNIMVIPALGDFLDSTQLTAQYWQAVGVDAKVQTVDRTLFYDRKDANEHDAAVFLGSGGMGDALFEPTFYFPFWNESLFAVPWGNLVCFGRQSGRGASGRSQEADGALSRDPEDGGSGEAERADAADCSTSLRTSSMPSASQRRAPSTRRSRTTCTISMRGRSPGPIRARWRATPSSISSIRQW